MTRYAIYAIPGVQGDADAPAATALQTAAEAWFSRDEMQSLTIDARRYGFHATLKAPFSLAPGATEDELVAAVTAFADTHTEVVIPAPAPASLGEFRALVPHGDETELAALAADAVRELDGFRAPPTELEVRRRRPERMTARERELFEAWGYPYVLEQFRFHMTLTDPIPAHRAPQIDRALEAHFGAVSGIDVPLRAITICSEGSPGDSFAVHSIHPLVPSLQGAS